jgi:hypothetical protein
MELEDATASDSPLVRKSGGRSVGVTKKSSSRRSPPSVGRKVVGGGVPTNGAGAGGVGKTTTWGAGVKKTIALGGGVKTVKPVFKGVGK